MIDIKADESRPEKDGEKQYFSSSLNVNTDLHNKYMRMRMEIRLYVHNYAGRTLDSIYAEVHDLPHVKAYLRYMGESSVGKGTVVAALQRTIKEYIDDCYYKEIRNETL